MPELPEVETVMRGLQARLEGRTILRAVTRREGLRRPFPPGLAQALSGQKVAGFRRRAKYMLMRLGSGRSVLLHLGMSGRILLSPEDGSPPAPHEHLSLLTDENWRVAFIDPRRFGLVDLVDTAAEDSHELLAGLGPEPLESGFTPAVLAAALAGRQSPVKTVLLDQTVVAGLGNIYVCEALFRARISPRRLAAHVGKAGVARLVAAIRAVLAEAIAAGGSSLRDYVKPSGELGYFQHAWKVYGREGERCERCPGPPACHGIARISQAGRSSFFCARTQK